MTDLTHNLKRLTAAKTNDGSPVVVKLSPTELTLTPKGKIRGRKISWSDLYELLGVELDLEQRWVTSVKVRGVPLIAKPSAFGLTITEKGDNHGYTLPWQAIYEEGARLKAQDDARDKRRDKALRKLGGP